MAAVERQLRLPNIEGISERSRERYFSTRPVIGARHTAATEFETLPFQIVKCVGALRWSSVDRHDPPVHHADELEHIARKHQEVSAVGGPYGVRGGGKIPRQAARRPALGWYHIGEADGVIHRILHPSPIGNPFPIGRKRGRTALRGHSRYLSATHGY